MKRRIKTIHYLFIDNKTSSQSVNDGRQLLFHSLFTLRHTHLRLNGDTYLSVDGHVLAPMSGPLARRGGAVDDVAVLRAPRQVSGHDPGPGVAGPRAVQQRRVRQSVYVRDLAISTFNTTMNRHTR